MALGHSVHTHYWADSRDAQQIADKALAEASARRPTDSSEQTFAASLCGLPHR